MQYIVSKASEIQSLIDSCHAKGGGQIVFTPGDYVTKTLFLKSNVTIILHAGARLLGSCDRDDYIKLPAIGSPLDGQALAPYGMALIVAENIENAGIVGEGIIDGQGTSFFDRSGTSETTFYPKGYSYLRPRMIQCYRCRNLRFEGVLFKDSPRWTFWIIDSEEVSFRGIRIEADPKMINNDGIHLDSSHNIRISDCSISTADDCIVIRAIPKGDGKIEVCENVVITNCLLRSSCQCIRIGCPSDGDVKNCVISNCVCRGRRGIIFNNPQRYVRKGIEKGVFYDQILLSNLSIEVDERPIVLDVDEGVILRKFGGITFSNIRMKGGLPCELRGAASSIIRDVHFSQIVVDKMPVVNEYCSDIKFDQFALEGVNFNI